MPQRHHRIHLHRGPRGNQQQLPLVLSVMRHYEDQAIKTKNVRGILEAIEHFHFAFTAIASQRSSGGISFMYALAARELYQAKNLEAKVKVLTDFQKNKLKTKRPQYVEFEPSFMELRRDCGNLDHPDVLVCVFGE